MRQEAFEASPHDNGPSASNDVSTSQLSSLPEPGAPGVAGLAVKLRRSRQSVGDEASNEFDLTTIFDGLGFSSRATEFRDGASCGSMIHGARLVLPYSFSDFGTRIATLPLDDLLTRLTQG